VAAIDRYWSNLHTLKAIVSALLAALLWPLLVAVISRNIR
jgi:hypothetical protein